MKLIDKIKNNKKNIIIYSLVILVTILLRKHQVYTAFIIFGMLLVFNKNKNISKIVLFPLITLMAYECIYFIYYKQRITPAILDSIIESNQLEVTRMLHSGQIIFLILSSLFIGCFLSFIKRIDHLKYSQSLRPLFLVSFISLITTDVAKIFLIYKTMANIREDNKTLGLMLYEKYPFVIGDIAYLITSITSNNRYQKYENNLKNNKIILDHENNDKPIENIIIVLGESSSSLQYSSYGYHVNTTPHMNEIFSQSDGCIINSVHSSAPLTRSSVSMTFSFATPESDEPLFKEKNIIDLAKENGYKTYWISSQALSGLHESKFGYIAKKSDVINLTKNNDDRLNGFLEKILNDKDKGKKFIVLHMIGSHMPYINFDSIDKKSLPEASDYDLTIHHTDRIINAIYNTLKSNIKNYVLYFTSDHGEIINVGHALKGAKEQYFIPLMIIDKSNNDLCKYTNLLRNKDGYISGLMHKYIITKMLGYKLNENIINIEVENDRVIDAANKVLTFKTIESYY